MSTIRRFCCNDFLRFASANLDYFTLTGEMADYFISLVRYPDYFLIALAPGNRIMGYVAAGVREIGEQWFSQVTVVAVKPEYRRRGLGTKLLRLIENELLYKMDSSPGAPSYTMRLVVGVSNRPAIQFLTKFGFRAFQGQKKKNTKEKFEMRKILHEDGFLSFYGDYK